MPFDVVGLGLNAVDQLCTVPEYPRFNTKTRIQDYRMLGGGQTATAMTVCGRFGLRAAYLGKVGSDERGRFSRRSLEAEPLDLSGLITVEGAYNQYAIIIVDARSGERTILWDRDPALRFDADDWGREKICAGRVLHLDGHEVPASIRAARWAREAGIPVSLDSDTIREGYEALLENVDILISSESFPARLTGISSLEKALEKIAGQYGCAVTGATLGREGSLVYCGGRFIRTPGHRVACADTTGAGDVFHGAFIYAMLQGWELEEVLSFANIAAALKCTKPGARAAIPGLPEVMQVFR
jgi:sugar/nucleoside kinase (ribokinase family)